jgi:hypothetical protein
MVCIYFGVSAVLATALTAAAGTGGGDKISSMRVPGSLTSGFRDANGGAWSF